MEIDSEGTTIREVLHYYDWRSFSWPVQALEDQPDMCTLPCAHNGPSCKQSAIFDNTTQFKDKCFTFFLS